MTAVCDRQCGTAPEVSPALQGCAAGASSAGSRVAYIVRCRRCGMARRTYNDIRLPHTTIECRRPCAECHAEWSLERVVDGSFVWPQPRRRGSDGDGDGDGDEEIPVFIPVRPAAGTDADAAHAPFGEDSPSSHPRGQGPVSAIEGAFPVFESHGSMSVPRSGEPREAVGEADEELWNSRASRHLASVIAEAQCARVEQQFHERAAAERRATGSRGKKKSGCAAQ